jgi:hypothetical protein
LQQGKTGTPGSRNAVRTLTLLELRRSQQRSEASFMALGIRNTDTNLIRSAVAHRCTFSSIHYACHG